MTAEAPASKDRHYFRFHRQHAHLHTTFGNDWFALKAEAFARFFGTPVFLIAQTFINRSDDMIELRAARAEEREPRFTGS